MSGLFSMNDLGCGVVTPEGYDDEKQEALHVLNVNLIGEENVNRVLEFMSARIQHFARHLPGSFTQQVIFDIRGQRPNPERMNRLKQTIIDRSAEQGISVTIDYYMS